MVKPTFNLPLDAAGVTSRESLNAEVNRIIDVVYDDKVDTSHTHTASQISDSTSAGRSILTAANPSAQRTALGLGTAATTASADYAAAVHTHSIANVTGLQGALDGITAKTNQLTVTAPVNLDTMSARINDLDAAVVLRGSWSAAAGTFPGGGAAQAGSSWIVSVAGTVGEIAFLAGDRIVAITDNASTTVYAGNWLHLDYTDQVSSVAGRTGAVVLGKADVGLSAVDNTADAGKPVSAAQASAISAAVEGETVRAKDAEAILRAGVGRIVPVIGAGVLAGGFSAWSPAGELIEAMPRRTTFIVPRLGDAASVRFTPFGTAVDVELDAFAAGSVEQRSIAGQVTGRVLPQVHVRRTDAAWVAVTNGPAGAEIASVNHAGGVATVSRCGVVQPAKWRTSTLGDGATMHLVLIVGQSLAQGFTDESPAANGAFDRYPVWRDHVAERAWQFKAGDSIQRGPRPFQIAPNFVNRNVPIATTQLDALEPLRGSLHAENSTFAQTSAESLAAALIGQHLNPRDHVLTAIVGTGATAIVSFGVGTAHMTSVERVISAGATQAAARGLSLSVWLVWNQGEQDNADGTTQAAYQAAWIAIRDHIQAQAIAAGGTYGGAVIQQCSQRPGGATGMATLAHAALVAAGEAVAVPVYPMLPGHSGPAHLFPATYFPLGAATAWAISRLIEAGSTSPYVPTGNATLVSSTVIDCQFTSRQGQMRFDTVTIPNDGQYGVRVETSGGNVTISAFEWVGAATLRLTLASPVLIGDAPVVRFGLSGSNVLLPGASGPRVNIRDGSEWPCPITGQIVSGWVLQHQVAVTA